MRWELASVAAATLLSSQALAEPSVEKRQDIGQFVAEGLGFDVATTTVKDEPVSTSIDASMVTGETSSSQRPSSNACTWVAQEIEAITGDASNEITSFGEVALPASMAYECLISVPLKEDDALQFIDYAKQYMAYQSTVEFLKDPPAGYQQRPVDIIGKLDELKGKVQDGSITTQYDFDYEVFLIEAGAHDTHFTLQTGFINNPLFFFKLDFPLATVSKDGKELPKVYAYGDISAPSNSTSSRNSTWAPSAIETIEGLPAVEYLASFAATRLSTNVIESHAEWNLIMVNPAQNFAQGSEPLFNSGFLYNGDTLSGKFENGTEFEISYVAYARMDMTNMTDPEDIYTTMVLAASTDSSEESEPTPTPDSLPNIPIGGYPDDPIVKMEPLASGYGTITGYLLEKESIGVLSIPSFDSAYDQLQFRKPILSFIKKAKAAGIKKVVIDTSGNGGGIGYLGYDVFRMFFPNLYPYEPFFTHHNDQVDNLGLLISTLAANKDDSFAEDSVSSAIEMSNTLAGYSASLYFKGDGFNTKNGTGSHFEDWDDYYDPGENQTALGQWNFVDAKAALGYLDYFVYGFGNNTAEYDEPPWAAEDLVILSDGQCGSTCASFAHIMKHIAGVKTVAVGGAPVYGPMQHNSGNRGGGVTDWSTFDSFITGLIRSSPSNDTSENARIAREQKALFKEAGVSASFLNKTFPPPLKDLRYQVNGRLNFVSTAVRDEVVPYQFVYEPADCRLFYTPQMIRDKTTLWKITARILGGNYDACVKGSTNQNGSQNEGILESPGFDSSFEAFNETWKQNATWGSKNVLKDGEKNSPSTPSPTRVPPPVPSETNISTNVAAGLRSGGFTLFSLLVTLFVLI